MQRWVGLGVLIAMLALAGCSSDDPPPLAPAARTPARAGDTPGTTTVSDPYRSPVAEALVPSVKVYDHEGATTPVRTITQPNDPPRPLVFLVQKEHQPL